MAVRAPRPFDARGEAEQIRRNLAMIGSGLRDVMDPNWRQKQQVRNFMLQNPETFQRMAEAQMAAEERAAERIADAQTEEGRMPNVLSPFGFSFEETKALMAGAPPLTPEEELSRKSATAMSEAGVPEARAEATGAQLGAQTEQAESTERAEETFQTEGGPEITGRQRAQEARTGLAQNLTQQDYWETLDGQLKGEAQNMQLEAQRVLGEVERDKAEDYLGLRADVMEGKYGEQFRRDFMLAESNPEMLQAILARERMQIDEWAELLKARRERGMTPEERIRLTSDLRDRVDEARNEIFEGLHGDMDLSDSQLQSEIADFNQEVARLAEVAPEQAANMVAIATEEFLGGMGVEFEPTPAFVNLLGKNPEMIQPTLDVLTNSRTGQIFPDEELPNPENLSPEQFNNQIKALAGDAANRMMNLPKVRQAIGTQENPGPLMEAGQVDAFRETLRINAERRLRERAQGLDFGQGARGRAGEVLTERRVLDPGASDANLDRVIGGFIRSLFVDPESQGVFR